MKTYRVIWFDDECQSLNIINEKASLAGINLIGFNNAKDGIAELEANIFNYDAAVVDGKFFRSPGQAGDAISDNALADVALALQQLKARKDLPWFILSGQISFTKETNPFADAFRNNEVYDKLDDDDLTDLWQAIKQKADQQVDTQIRHRFNAVFNVCSDEYIGSEAQAELLRILQKESQENAFVDPMLYFNPLRKIIEDFFRAANRVGFLPDIFVTPHVALNESSKFLSGQIEKGYQLDAPVFPKVVSDMVRSILSVCQPAAHRSEIDSFVAQVKSPYLLLSITYQLLDVLLWFKDYVDLNNDVPANKARYTTIKTDESVTFTGIIGKDSAENFYCSDILIPYSHMTNMSYKEGDKIKILQLRENRNSRSKHLYKNIAWQTEPLS